jgi:hypothetical protein
MDNISSELSEMKRLLIRISPAKVSGSLFDIPFREIPEDFVAEEDKRDNQGLYYSKRTPKPLDFSQVAKNNNKTINQEILERNDPEMTPPAPPTAPPIAPPTGKSPKPTQQAEKRNINTKDLNPPPEPPAIDSVSDKSSEKPLSKSELRARGRAHARRDIISELKDLFKKRGIVE